MTETNHVEHSATGTTTTMTTTTSTTYDLYQTAISQIDTEPLIALTTFQDIAQHVANQSYFSTSSTSSETIEDISTTILPYITVDHYIGLTLLQIPIVDQRTNIIHRKENLVQACDYFNAFLQKLEAYDILTKEERVQYHSLVEAMDHISSNSSDDNNVTAQPVLLPTTMNRDTKIAHHRRKQQLQQEQSQLQALQLRRQRLQTTGSNEDDTTMLDGYDHESLLRTTTITSIRLAILTTMEEWASILQELPMIAMMLLRQAGTEDDRYTDTNASTDTRTSSASRPLQLTQITQDSTTGQLRIHRQEVQQKTFRPSWNQPTMSLEEFAHREVTDAIQRQEQQQVSEQYNMTQPRRYTQLLKDGMEDDTDLVDASIKLDEQWDTFKEDNPRGSGNKRGDVGDRNF
jgi:immunoglobulin-binding protein 1